MGIPGQRPFTSNERVVHQFLRPQYRLRLRVVVGQLGGVGIGVVSVKRF